MSVVLGLIRMKVAALALGAVGVGMIGLLQNLLNASATLAGMNIAVSGSRHMVATMSTGDEGKVAAARRAIFLTVLVLTIASGLLFWIFREIFADLLFEDGRQTANVGLLALGVAATAAAGYQTAILTAARRIGDLALLSIISAIIAAIVGSLCVLIWREDGIIPFVIASPIATLAFGWIFVRRLGRPLNVPANEPLSPHIESVLRLGAALTISIFVSLCGQLLIRTMIERQLGSAPLGHFQASWTITTVYLFFIFQVMGSDYLPRLTAAMNDERQAQQLVNEQAEIGMMLAAPILLIVIGAAPFVLAILYSSEFVAGDTLLRWQILGDLVRLVSWPVGFVLLAGRASRDYTIVEVIGTALLVGAAWLFLPLAGLAAPGMAYVFMNLCYWAVVVQLVQYRFGIRVTAHVFQLFASLLVSCALVFFISDRFDLVGVAAGFAAAIGWALFAFVKLRSAGALPFGR